MNIRAEIIKHIVPQYPRKKVLFSLNVQLKLPAMSFFDFKSKILFIFPKESGEPLTFD